MAAGAGRAYLNGLGGGRAQARRRTAALRNGSGGPTAMWTTVGRMVAVFVVWGAVFALAVARGVHAGHAEVASSVGAGLSLAVWGVWLARKVERTSGQEQPPQQHERLEPPPRERATV